jgi:hypothetical protein
VSWRPLLGPAALVAVVTLSLASLAIQLRAPVTAAADGAGYAQPLALAAAATRLPPASAAAPLPTLARLRMMAEPLLPATVVPGSGTMPATLAAVRATPSPPAGLVMMPAARVAAPAIGGSAIAATRPGPVVSAAAPAGTIATAARQPASVSAPAGARPTVPRLVHLHVRGQSGARALVDDVAVGVLPLDLDLPAVARSRRLVVATPGRQFAQEVAGDVDAFVLVEAVGRNQANSQRVSARVRPRRNPFSR